MLMPTNVWEPLAYPEHSSLDNAMINAYNFMSNFLSTMQYVATDGVIKSPQKQSLYYQSLH